MENIRRRQQSVHHVQPALVEYFLNKAPVQSFVLIGYHPISSSRINHFCESVCQPGLIHSPRRNTKISVARPNASDRLPATSVSNRYSV